MPKLIPKILLFSLFVLSFFSFLSLPILAADDPTKPETHTVSCSDKAISVTYAPSVAKGTTNYTVTVNFGKNINPGDEYYIYVPSNAFVDVKRGWYSDTFTPWPKGKPSPTAGSYTFTLRETPPKEDTFNIQLQKVTGAIRLNDEKICDLGRINIYKPDFYNPDLKCDITMPNNIKSGDDFVINLGKDPKADLRFSFGIFRESEIKGGSDRIPNGVIPSGSIPINGGATDLTANYLKSNDVQIKYTSQSGVSNHWSVTSGDMFDNKIPIKQLSDLQSDKYIALMIARDPTDTSSIRFCGKHPFVVSSENTSEPTLGEKIKPPATPGQTGAPCVNGVSCTISAGRLCDPATGREGGVDGVLTAIGCVPVKPDVLINYLLRFATGIGGGVALLLMIAGAFKVVTSAGNPDAMKDGRSQITSAVIGLLFIIFSVLLMQIIGVNILQIQGFTP